MATKLFAFVLALCAMGACRSDVCARKSDCAHGLTCSAEGLCVTAPDGGTSEEPVTDAGVDAGSDVDGGM